MIDRKNNPPSAPVPGDVNEELAKFLRGGPTYEYDDYTFALLFGGPIQSREERLICAADQLLLCTFSSGLFSYFELQPEHASSGIEAFTELGLPDFARLVRHGLELLTLDCQASASEIQTASKELVGDGLEHFLDEAEPLEIFVDENASVLSKAISEYIRKNSDKLWRTLQ